MPADAQVQISADAAAKSETHALTCNKHEKCGLGELTFEERADGSLGAKIGVTGGGEHECIFEGVLVADPAKPSAHWTYDDVNDGPPCHIDLTRGTRTFTLTSEGCRYYCGARAVLTGEFALATSAPLPPE
jgi:hypothetical protein